MHTNAAWNADMAERTRAVEEQRRKTQEIEAQYAAKKEKEKEERMAQAERDLQIEIECARLGLYGKTLSKRERRYLEMHRKKKGKKYLK